MKLLSLAVALLAAPSLVAAGGWFSGSGSGSTTGTSGSGTASGGDGSSTNGGSSSSSGASGSGSGGSGSGSGQAPTVVTSVIGGVTTVFTQPSATPAAGTPSPEPIPSWAIEPSPSPLPSTFGCRAWTGEFLVPGTKIAVAFDVTVAFALGTSIKYEKFVASPVWLHAETTIGYGVRGFVAVEDTTTPPANSVFVVASGPVFDASGNQGYTVKTLNGDPIGFSGPRPGAPDGYLYAGGDFAGSIEPLYLVRNGVASDPKKTVAKGSSAAFLARETTRVDFCEIKSYDGIHQALECIKARTTKGCTGSASDSAECRASRISVYVCEV